MVLGVTVCALGVELLAQPAPTTQPGESAATTRPAAIPSLIPSLPDYSGDLWHRQYMTGDWGGARTELAEHGITFDLDATQVLQGNAHGGKDTNNAFRYSGSADYKLTLDSARMGLWPAGVLTLRGETQFGQSINKKAGSILGPNFDALLPVPDDSGATTLSEFYLSQGLIPDKVVFVAGKIDLTTGDGNVFAHDERTQFLNAGFRVNPVLFTAAPYTTMAAGLLVTPTQWLSVSTFVCDNDPDGAATTTGFNTAFHGRDWMSILQEYDFTLKLLGQTGHQRFGWFWTSRDLALLDQDIRVGLPRLLVPRVLFRSRPVLRAIRMARLARSFGLDYRPDDWGMYYNFDQYLYTKADDPTQGFGLFGRFGMTTGEGSPFERFYSLGLGGKGLISTRPRDAYGVGYCITNLSDDFPDVLNMSDEQAVELFYNIEVTPWLHLTPDLQMIVRPGGGFRDRDVAIVYGLRAQMTF
jgi:porin